MRTALFDGTGARLAAYLIAFLLPIRALAPLGIGSLTPGIIFGVGIVAVATIIEKDIVFRRTPVWWVVALVLVTAASGVFLSWFASDTRTVLTTIGQSTLLLLICGGITVIVLIWCASKVGLAAMIFTYAAGAVFQALLTTSSWLTNPWKYAFAWPVTLIVLVIVSKQPRSVVAVVLFAIGVYSSLNGFRSFFGFAIFAFLLIVAPKLRGRSGRTPSPLLPIGAMAAVGFVVYTIAQRLAISGYLGQRNLDVTRNQLAEGSNFILGGRPELAASWNLFLHRPWGYGPGVVPTGEDAAIGKDGLRSVGAPTDTAYVNSYLFSDHFELHSVAADLWVNFGLVGMVLAALLAIVVGRELAHEALAERRAYLIMLYVVGLWDLMFSPIQSNWSHVFLAFTAAIIVMSQRKLKSQPQINTLVNGGVSNSFARELSPVNSRNE